MPVKEKKKPKGRPEPKTRVCMECRIRQVVANMEKVDKVWYCHDCAGSNGGSSVQPGVAGTR